MDFSIQASSPTSRAASDSEFPNSIDPAMLSSTSSASARVRRPMNKFMLFKRDMLAEKVQAIDACKHVCDKTRIIAEMWRNAPPDVVEYYTRMQEAEKIEHAEEHPGYKYQPKKRCRTDQEGTELDAPPSRRRNTTSSPKLNSTKSIPPYPVPRMEERRDQDQAPSANVSRIQIPDEGAFIGASAMPDPNSGAFTSSWDEPNEPWSSNALQLRMLIPRHLLQMPPSDLTGDVFDANNRVYTYTQLADRDVGYSMSSGTGDEEAFGGVDRAGMPFVAQDMGMLLDPTEDVDATPQRAHWNV